MRFPSPLPCHRARLSLALVTAVAATVVGSSIAATPPKQHAASPRAWKALVAQAQKEGSVTLYSSQDPGGLGRMADAFKAKYGISVTWSRQIDSISALQINAEASTHNAKADVWVIASLPYVLGALKNGWTVPAVGPDLFAKGYDRKIFAGPGKAVIVGTAVQGIGWNTSYFPQGIKDYPDLLNARLAGGKIGVVSPSGPSLVDSYLMLEQHYGAGFLAKLGAQKPKIYPSTLPQQQALASGEIAASALVGAQVLDLKAQGAPVDFAIPKGGAWNAPWWAMALKQAPHPAAAQLLIDFMATRAGQQALNRRYGAVLKNIPDTFYVLPRRQKLADLTPAKVTAFQESWNKLFH